MKRPARFDVSRNPKQVEALWTLSDPAYKKILLDGGARSGKTDVLAHWLFSRCERYPGSRHIILRKNRAHARDSLWRETLTRYLDRFVPSMFYVLKSEDMVVEWHNGSSILLDGCDDEVRVRRLFGREYLTVWFNEASEFEWPVVQNLFSRVVQLCQGPDGPAPCKVVFDSNPRGKRHWLYKAGVLHMDPATGNPLPDADRWARVGGWTIYDNAKNLNPDAIAEYEALTGVTRRRLLDAEWCEQEGLVFDEFNEARHVVPVTAVRRGKRWLGRYQVRSVDFGFRDPFVCLWGTVDQDRRLIVFQEWYRRGVIVSDHAARIREMSEGMTVSWTVADHDAEDAATLKAHGVRTRRAIKDRPIRAGIDRVKRRLRDRQLLITENCKQLLSEMSSYSWDSGEDEPIDKDNHAIDALRYMVAELDGKGRSWAVPI